jgi:hypothetical protein
LGAPQFPAFRAAAYVEPWLILAAFAYLYVLTPSANAQAPTACDAAGDLEFICGPRNVEDMSRIAGTKWVITSNVVGPKVSGNGFTFINMDSHAVLAVDPDTMAERPDPIFGGCTRLAKRSFRGHGLAIGAHPLRLYAVNHGARESIEIFDIEIAQGTGQPRLSWAGCVIAPAGVNLNAVTPLPGGGIAATRFQDAGETFAQGIAKAIAGEPIGHVVEWHPTSGWMIVPESYVAGANGLLITPDGRYYFIAAWGDRRLIRLSRNAQPIERKSIDVGFYVDNLRWDDKGKVIAVGQVLGDVTAEFLNNCLITALESCAVPYRIIRVDPVTLRSELLLDGKGMSHFGAATVAIDAGNEWWIGTARGDRVARLRKSR